VDDGAPADFGISGDVSRPRRGDSPAAGPARVRQVGLMIADRQVGTFALEVRSISAE